MAKKELVLDADIVVLWDQLVEVFKDGKVAPEEVPTLLETVGQVLTSIAALLGTWSNVDPKIKAILSLVGVAMGAVAKSLAAQTPKLVAAWTVISAILRDGKISPLEAPRFIGAVADLLEALLAVCLPFVNLEFSGQAQKALQFLQRVAGLFGGRRGSAELNGAIPK